MTTYSSFQSLGSHWVALHVAPKAVIQFIGGAFFGTFPILVSPWGANSYFAQVPLVSYHFLLKNLLRAGYSIALIPYLLTVNHWSGARQLLVEQQQLPSKLLKVAENLGYPTRVYQNPADYFWVGHSLGCEYITLLRFLSRKSQPSENPELLNPLLGIENQPALLMAPCFQPPAWLKLYKKPTQALARQLLVETAQRAPTAMLSFNQDFTAGNLVERTGDVYWIHRQLVHNSADGLMSHRELPGNHYQPLGYDTGDRNLVNHVINCLERLKICSSPEGTKQSLSISSNP